MRSPGGAAKLHGVLRCVIVDDNASFLAAARALLEREGLPVLGVAANQAEALTVIEGSQPDVVLVDVTLGQESGFELARRLATGEFAGQVVLISTYSEADLAELLADAPVRGFLTKSQLSAAAVRRLVSEPRDT